MLTIVSPFATNTSYSQQTTTRIMTNLFIIIASYIFSHSLPDLISEILCSDDDRYLRKKLFLQKKERILALTSNVGRLWKFSGPTFVDEHFVNSCSKKIASALHNQLLLGHYAPKIGRILAPKHIPHDKISSVFQLFVSLVLFPECCIFSIMCHNKISYLAAEQFFLQSEHLLKVITDYNDLS